MQSTLKLCEDQKAKTRRHMGKLDAQFAQIQRGISETIDLIGRHQRIKVQAWLKKLDMRMDNLVWKQNRNFYMRVLHEMMIARDIMQPFSRAPPEGPLPTLTPYDVPYPLRTKFLNRSEKEHKPHMSQNISKNNSMENSFVSTRKVSINQLNKENIGWNDNNANGRESDLPKRSHRCSRDPIQRKKERPFFAETNRRISFNQGNACYINKSVSPDEPRIEEAETLRKELFKKVGLGDRQPSLREDISCKSNNCHTEELMEAKTFALLKRTFKFLVRNYDVLQDQHDYKSLISDVIRLGDEKKVDLRSLNVELSPSPSKIVFKKYSNRIKEKLESSGQQSKQFLQFLNILRNR